MAATEVQQLQKVTESALEEVSDELKLLASWEIGGEEDLEFASDMVQDVKRRRSLLERKRRAIVDPMNRALREVNSLFRPPLRALEQAERVLKKKIAGYLRAVEECNKAAARKASEAQTPEQAARAFESGAGTGASITRRRV